MKTKRFKLTVEPERENLSDEELEERKKLWAEWKASGKKVAKVKSESPKSSRIVRTTKIQNPTVVCSGITKKGLPCRNRTKSPTGYCHIH